MDKITLLMQYVSVIDLCLSHITAFQLIVPEAAAKVATIRYQQDKVSGRL